MADADNIPLRNLREDPFELLQQMERRSRLNLAAQGAVTEATSDLSLIHISEPTRPY